MPISFHKGIGKKFASGLAKGTQKGFDKGLGLGLEGLRMATKDQRKEDPLAQLLHAKRLDLSEERMRDLQQERARRGEERQERRVRGVGEDVRKHHVPEQVAAMGSVEEATRSPSGGGIFTDPKAELKSAGPIASAMPASMINIGEKLSNVLEPLGVPRMLERGAGAERQALQQLMNIEVRRMAGTAQTPFETGRQMVAQGLTAGGDPEMVRKGMEKIQEAVKLNVQSIQAGDPEAFGQFKAQGGVTSLQDLLQGPKAQQGAPTGSGAGSAPPSDDDIARMTPEQLKAYLGQQ